ncbi:MAG: FAD-binding oxidoreductase [Lapillicoccus sp.]
MSPAELDPSREEASSRRVTPFSGWGRTAATQGRPTGPLDGAAISELLARGTPRGVLARGAGRSYGDAAQNAGGTIVTSVATMGSNVIEVTEDVEGVGRNAGAVTAKVGASTSFEELLSVLVPQGLLPPVLPGTRHVTMGGALAGDVHGKNHHVDGSIARWVRSLDLIGGDGVPRTLSPLRHPQELSATVGGMGLTGVITSVTVEVIRIRSAHLRVRSLRAPDLDTLMGHLVASTSRYAVAWVDASACGRALGRGVVDEGDHLEAPLPEEVRTGLAYRPAWAPTVPGLPIGPVTRHTAQAFNSAWFHSSPRAAETTAGIPAYFHRLDALSGWNRALGPHGFVQYQFVVPDESAGVVARVLEILEQHRVPCFLGTLKRFGAASDSPLSFPQPGWSLALDLPVGRVGAELARVLDEVDATVAAGGGRVYLCKDARLGRGHFDEMYGPLEDWRRTRATLDPGETMRSDLGRRLGLCR